MIIDVRTTAPGSRDVPALVSNGRPRPASWPAYVATGWTLVFIAFHIYWYLGGHLGLGDAPDALPGMPSSVGNWILSFVVWAMFVAGVVVPLALVRPWGRTVPRWILLDLTWLGSAVLAVRGVAGIADDLLRVTHILPNGLTGLTYEQILGEAQPSAYTLWSGASIDAYFLIGGILFGVAAWALRDRSQVVRERDSRPTRND